MKKPNPEYAISETSEVKQDLLELAARIAGGYYTASKETKSFAMLCLVKHEKELAT